jgi:hypothetical protein
LTGAEHKGSTYLFGPLHQLLKVSVVSLVAVIIEDVVVVVIVVDGVSFLF